MSKSDSEIVRLAGRHVFELFSNASADVPLIYHGFKRSRGLVDDCREIAKGNKLDGAEGDVLLLSAWFHDAGYAARKDGGREESIELAQTFLASHGQRARARSLADVVASCLTSAGARTPATDSRATSCTTLCSR